LLDLQAGNIDLWSKCFKKILEMVITKRIIKSYGWIVTFTKFWIREFKTLTPMPISARLRMWFNGFFSAAWYRYEFYKGNKISEYVSDYAENLRASRINKDEEAIFVDNKVIFPLFFSHFAPVVKNFGFIHNGIIVPQDSDNNFTSFEDIINHVRSGNKIIIKPIAGQRGGDVKVLSLEYGLLKINGKEYSYEDFINSVKKLNNYIICPFIKQSEFSQRLYPNTTNTLRILTMIDPDSGKAFIAHAVQRIGTKHSFPVDNFAVGGLTFNIDIESGILGHGSYIIPTESRKVWYKSHPETGETITGEKIPRWELIKDQILKMANIVSFLKIIGWDLIVTDTQEAFVLLEGNNCACFKVHQLHGGFRLNERINRFMKHYKVVR